MLECAMRSRTRRRSSGPPHLMAGGSATRATSRSTPAPRPRRAHEDEGCVDALVQQVRAMRRGSGRLRGWRRAQKSNPSGRPVNGGAAPAAARRCGCGSRAAAGRRRPRGSPLRVAQHDHWLARRSSRRCEPSSTLADRRRTDRSCVRLEHVRTPGVPRARRTGVVRVAGECGRAPRRHASGLSHTPRQQGRPRRSRASRPQDEQNLPGGRRVRHRGPDGTVGSIAPALAAG
jgi:hypothetical protein